MYSFEGKIIWSADVDGKALQSIVGDENFPPDVAVKLDRLFFETHEKSYINLIQEWGNAVFADAKIIEIPDKCIEIAKKYLEYQPWMLNIMAGALSTGLATSDNPKKVDALKQFADLCHGAGTRSCAVTVLTSKTEEICDAEFLHESEEQVLFYTEKLIEFGFTDLVCSPQEAVAIRREFGHVIDLNTPGVRLPDSSKDDQARVSTPYDALKAGVDRLVIGRDLSRDGDFAGNYAKILANIEGRD